MSDAVKRYIQRRDARLRKRLDEEQWITIKGTHVMVDDDGQISRGPDTLKSIVKSSGGYKAGSKKSNMGTPEKNLPAKETTPLRNGSRDMSAKKIGPKDIDAKQKEVRSAQSAVTRAKNAFMLASGAEKGFDWESQKQLHGEGAAQKKLNELREKTTEAHTKYVDAQEKHEQLSKEFDDMVKKYRGNGVEKSIKESSSEPESDNVKKWSAGIDKQAFTRKGENEWELIPKDKDISSAGASIKKVGNKYEATTWGTSDIQKSDLETRGKATLKSSWNSLAEAKTAAKEELKGYLPSVKGGKEKRFVDTGNIEKMPERPHKPNIDRMNKVVDGVFKDLGGEVTGDYGDHSNTKYFSVPEKTPVKNLATNIVDSLRKKGYAAEFVKNTSHFRDLSDKPTSAIWVGNGTNEGTYGVTYELSVDKDYRKSPGKVGVRLERVQSY